MPGATLTTGTLVLDKTLNCPTLHLLRQKPMNRFLEDQQIEETFDFLDEETKFEVESFYEYDDLTGGLDFSSANDF